MSAEDIINKVKQRKLNMPTTGVPPTYPPAPTTTVPPTTPKLVIPAYVPADSSPQTTTQSSGDTGSNKSNRSFLSNVLAIPGGVGSYVVDVAKGLPTLGKDIVMTGAGLGEEVFSAVDETVIPFYDYDTRAEKRKKQGEAMGLKGYDLIGYTNAHTFPLITKFADSVQTLGSNVLDPLQVVGGKDFGEPGINYVNAFNRGELSKAVLGDAGTVLTLGRLGGLGSLAEAGASRLNAAGAPRTATFVSNAGRFVEEPIGSTVRGTAYVTNLGLARTGRLPKLTDAAARVSTASSPLRQIKDETIAARRKYFEGELARLIVEENSLKQQMSTLPTDDPTYASLSDKLAKVTKQRENALSGTGRPKLMNQAIKAQQRTAQAIRTGWVTKVNRWGRSGSASEPVRVLDENARAARVRQQEASAAGDVELAQKYDDLASWYEDLAKAKASDTNGRLDPKTWDDQEKQTIWSAAVLTMTKVNEEILAAYYDRTGPANRYTHEQAVNWIAENITPPELHPDIATQGYAWTPQAIDRAIQFATGSLDQFDTLNIEGASRIISEFSDWFGRQAEAGIGRVTGAIPFTYKYNLPDPMNMLRELASRPRLKELIIDILDQAMAYILERDYMDIVTKDKIDLENPAGLFEKYAKQNFGSDQYRIAYEALTEAFDVLVADPQFSTFMRNKMIYPASMRPMLNTRENLVQAVRAEDVAYLADKMSELAVQNADLIPSRTLKSIGTAIKLALGEQTRYDVRTWTRLRLTINRLIADTQKAQAEFQGAGAKISTSIDSTLARLQEIEQFAVAAGALIDQVIANPEIAFPDITAGSPRLLAATQAEQANLSRINAIPDEIAQVDAEIKAEIDRQKTANAYLQQDLDNTQASLEQARTRATETADAEATLRQQLDQEQAYLDAFNKLTEEELAALRSPDGESPPPDLATALRIHNEYASGDKFVSKGTAQAVKRRLVEEATQRLTIAQGLVDSLMPSRLRRARTMTIGLATDPNAMSFMQEDFRAPFESAVYQAIGDPKLAKKAYNDFVNSRTVMDEGVAVDQLNMETGRDFASDSDFMAELGRAWAEQWLAEKDLGRAKQQSVESIRKELADSNQANIDQAIEESTVTGQTLPWIERMIELDDRTTLAEATRTVEGLRRDLAKAEQAAQKAQADVNRLTTKVTKLTDQVRPKVPNELLTRRSNLEKERKVTSKATSRLAGAVERAQKAEPKTQAMLIKRAQTARLRGVGRLKPDGTAEMLPGRAGKLDNEHQTLLAKQAELDAKLADVRRMAQEQETLEQQTEMVGREASRNVDRIEQVPYGPQRLQNPMAQPSRFAVDRPAWYPAGETSSVVPQARVTTQLRSEAAGAERPTTTEGLKTTNVMPMTANRFAERINQILGQWERNVVIQNLILDRRFVKDVASYFTEDQLIQFDIDARRKLSSQRKNLNSYQFEQLVKEEVGNTILRKLDEMGLEPVSKTKMPDPEDIYTGRTALNTLTDIVEGKDIDPTTLVMSKGMREQVASSFVPTGDTAIPNGVKRFFNFVGTQTARWKSTILPISVRWQVGDYMGNIINAWVRGDIDPKTMMEMMKLVDKLIREDTGVGKLQARTSGMTNKTFSNPILQALIGEGIQGRSLRIEDIRDMLEGSNRALPGGEVNPKFGRNFRTKAFNFNEYQNTQAKLAVAMVKLQEALDKQGRTMADIDPVSLHNDPKLHAAVTEAVQFANETLGAFSELSPFERNFVRQVFPFWSWVKFINTAAGKLLLDDPDRVLFYGHLGSMTMDPDAEGLYEWLRGQTPVAGYLFDLSFTNPYADALLFQNNPLEASFEQATSVSPVITFSLSGLGELAYGATGRKFPLLTTVSRPSYLEGRPGATTRTWGDTLGGVAYMGLKSFGGPARNLLDIGPSGTIPFTDIATGPGPKFPQGSLRTEGRYAQPRLSPWTSRISSTLRTFGLPAPTITVEEAARQAAEQEDADMKALIQRIRDRANAG